MGAKLAKIPGSICSKCYANKGFYATFAHVVIPAQERRLASIDGSEWVPAMVQLLKREAWFRWFDSGDLQSVEHLRKIVEVARNTPHCRHWLATRERGFVKEYLRGETPPRNLVIRVSATFPDIPVKPLKGALMANVHKNKPPVGHECPAPKQHGRCDTCRACWNLKVSTISYKEH